MEDIFLNIINFSITATYIAAAVMLIRLCIKKAPKWISGVLWGFVGLRLLFPFSIESIFSLIPNNKPIPDNITTMPKPEIDSGIPIINDTFNPIISNTFAPPPEASVNPMEVLMTVASYVWLIGIAAMLIYMAISFLRVRLNVRGAVRLEGNIYECKSIQTAFILGVIRPRIYIPAQMDKADLEFVVAHEKAHIKRLDHIWKPLGFLLLAVYWFNPVLWVAYVLLCRDIELACDEKVLKKMGIESKKRYSTALVNCSVENKMITACPLAFGEVGIKERVMRILNYKKPAFWVVCLSLVAVAVVAVCFLTDPIRNDPSVEGTPSIQLPDKAFELEDELIKALNEHFSIPIQYEVGDISLGGRIPGLKPGVNDIYHVVFNPDDYYYVGCYHVPGTNYYTKNFTWIGFNEPEDILESYDGKKLIIAAQINKSMYCRNLLTDSTTECVMEHILKYEPVWEDEINTAPPISFDETFIVSPDNPESKTDTIYFASADGYFYLLWGYKSTVIDGQCYITQPMYYINANGYRYDHDLKLELGQYYDDFMNVLITDKYNVIDDRGTTVYYGLIEINNFAEIIKKHIES